MSTPTASTPHADPGEKNWLALLSPAEVFGPFTREELQGYVASGQIAPTAQFFQRQASMDGVEGRIAELMRRTAEAEARSRDSEAATARGEANLKAKDLEFDGERQQMLADLSKLRAEGLRKEAEIEALRKEAGRMAEQEKARVELETKLMDRERRIAALAAELAEAWAKAEDGRTWKERAERLEKTLEGVRQTVRELGTRLEPAAASPQDKDGPVVADAEIVEPAEDPGTASGGRKDGDARLASLEALAQQELAKLRAQGGAKMPNWSRKRP